MEQIYLKCVRVIELDEGIDNTKTEDIYIIKTDDIYISKTEDIDISKTEDIDISKTEDIDISKTEDAVISKTEDIDISKFEDAVVSKTEDIDNTKNEYNDEDIDKSRNNLIQIFRCSKKWKDKKGNRNRRTIIWVFWDDDLISKLCEKWVYCDRNYGYTRFEELRKRSGEVPFTREHKATMSKEK